MLRIVIYTLTVFVLVCHHVVAQHDRPKDGYYEEFYESGQRKLKGYYKEGFQDSIWTFYDKSGRITSIGGLKNCDFQIGPTTITIRSCCHEKWCGRSNKYGPWKYFENGQLISQENYECGVLIGTQYLYYDSLHVKEVSTYHNGKLVAEMFYYESGAVNYQTVYGYDFILDSMGDYVETTKEFYSEYSEEGGIKIVTRTDTNEDGYSEEWIEYYPNGQIKSKEYIVNGNYEGEQLEYYENGWTKKREVYINDQKHGRAYYYDNRGICYKEEVWEEGKLIKTEYK